MKAKHIDCTTQVPEATLGQHPRAIGGKRAVENGQIGKQLAAGAIGKLVANGLLRSFEMIERLRGRQQPRIDQSGRPPVWLVLPISGQLG